MKSDNNFADIKKSISSLQETLTRHGQQITQMNSALGQKASKKELQDFCASNGNLNNQIMTNLQTMSKGIAEGLETLKNSTDQLLKLRENFGQFQLNSSSRFDKTDAAIEQLCLATSNNTMMMKDMFNYLQKITKEKGFKVEQSEHRFQQIEQKQKLPQLYNEYQTENLKPSSKASIIMCLPNAHSDLIESLAVHPSYKSFATGSHDKTIKLWDLSTLKSTMTLVRHTQGVCALNYNKEGTVLASGGPDKTVLIWDSYEGKPIRELSAHKDKIYTTKFNGSGKLLATCGQLGELFIWDMTNTEKPLFKLQLPSSLVILDSVWLQTEKLLVASTNTSQLLAFETNQFTRISPSCLLQGEVEFKRECLVNDYNPIQNRIFCGNSRGEIAQYQMENGKLVKQAEWLGHKSPVRTLNYHPSRDILLSTARNGSATLWNTSSELQQPQILEKLIFHQYNVPGAGFIGETIVVMGSWDKQLAFWSIKDLLK